MVNTAISDATNMNMRPGITDIALVNEFYRAIVPAELREKYFDVAKNPVLHGYNVVTSFRNGGKTTNELLWGLCANAIYGSHISYMRTSKSMITKSKIMTLFDSIISYVFPDGKNYIQKIYRDKYNTIYYRSREKVFVLGRVDDNDTKDNPIICYVHSVDQNDELRSGFADPYLDIVLYDEMMDGVVSNNTLINFLHILSTFFRSRYQSIVFMNCNMSTGNPYILHKMGVYEKILMQQTEYAVYKAKYGTQIGVSVLQVSDSFSNERNRMNTAFFGFDLDGIDIIRGSSIVREVYRELPTDRKYEIDDMNFYIYVMGMYLRVGLLTVERYQQMYYISEYHVKPPEEAVVLTDDKIYSFSYDNAHTYFNAGQDFELCSKVYRAYKLNNIVYENYMCLVALNSFYDYMT